MAKEQRVILSWSVVCGLWSAVCLTAGCRTAAIVEIPRQVSWDTPQDSFKLICWAISHDQPSLIYRSLAPSLKQRYEETLGIPVRIDTFLEAWERYFAARWKALTSAQLVEVIEQPPRRVCRFRIGRRQGYCLFRNYPYYEMRDEKGTLRDGYLPDFSLSVVPNEGWKIAFPGAFSPPDGCARFIAGHAWLLDDEPRWIEEELL